MITWLWKGAPEAQRTLQDIAARMVFLNIAAIHTTSSVSSHHSGLVPGVKHLSAHSAFDACLIQPCGVSLVHTTFAGRNLFHYSSRRLEQTLL
jgi:hypothetical protein